MFKKGLFAAALALPLSVSPVLASSVTFDPDAGGPINAATITKFDAAPGNVLTQNSGGATAQTIGQQVQSLFQANVAVITNGATNVFSPGSFVPCPGPGFCQVNNFTIVASIPEVISVGTNLATGTLLFDIDTTNPARPNYFYVYASGTPTPASDLAGNCFTCGTLILSGSFVDDAFFKNSFQVDLNGPLNQPLDCGPGFPACEAADNNYPGITTLTGTGGLDAHILVSFANTNYFKGLNAGDIFSWTASTKNNLPFTQTDPSACFDTDGVGVACTNFIGAGSAGVGPVNGEGTDVLLESDSSFTFDIDSTAVVPEPATLTLLGLGMMGTAAARRRKKNNK